MSVSNISNLQEVQALREENKSLRMIIELERLTEERFKNYSPQKTIVFNFNFYGTI